MEFFEVRVITIVFEYGNSVWYDHVISCCYYNQDRVGPKLLLGNHKQILMNVDETYEYY